MRNSSAPEGWNERTPEHFVLAWLDELSRQLIDASGRVNSIRDELHQIGVSYSDVVPNDFDRLLSDAYQAAKATITHVGDDLHQVVENPSMLGRIPEYFLRVNPLIVFGLIALADDVRPKLELLADSISAANPTATEKICNDLEDLESWLFSFVDSLRDAWTRVVPGSIMSKTP